ncbi:tyrosine--tRNA ligase [Candidatus Collierbacteria bacterium RIFOXYB1_FULL_49_13]|uniref:Tyrosine--tRNA ligase n=1 Tax=Candidatus Collierbacteria bacterium RIFOXYB1_FULL_49_13 TaxID=1817728 RepID=A0A1F5FJU1_9BACT|nr:MAG: tyrosine--tRNA ligase [Candidatus Collierbacteria bacterium RIFOXYB1_FULL_49_13]
MANQTLITDILDRGVLNIVPNRQALESLLKSDKKLNIYLGIDPTFTKIHLGHAFPLRKLKKLASLGHHVYFLIGDFTALIGDTSDKDKERPVLTEEEINHNFQTYKQQASKILDFDTITVVHNSDWLRQLTFTDIVKLTQHFSTGDFVNRELIKKRLQSGTKVGLHETLYPVMQGYDSYYLDTDIQLGGADQIFNMQAGRLLQKDLRNKESFIIANGFLTGTDGRKMSKSWGNAIWLDDQPADIFGKVMSISDDLINEYFIYGTDMPLDQIPEDLQPFTAKKLLAHTIVSELFDSATADTTQADFERTFSQKQTPEAAPIIPLAQSIPLLDLLVDLQAASSRSTAKTLIRQSGVSLSGTKITDLDFVVPVQDAILKVGKLKHYRLKAR